MAMPGASSDRVVVVWPVPAVVGGLIGQPRLSGLAWHLGVSRRSEVIEAMLRRGLAVPARSEVIS